MTKNPISVQRSPIIYRRLARFTLTSRRRPAAAPFPLPLRTAYDYPAARRVWESGSVGSATFARRTSEHGYRGTEVGGLIKKSARRWMATLVSRMARTVPRCSIGAGMTLRSRVGAMPMKLKGYKSTEAKIQAIFLTAPPLRFTRATSWRSARCRACRQSWTLV